MQRFKKNSVFSHRAALFKAPQVQMNVQAAGPEINGRKLSFAYENVCTIHYLFYFLIE